MTLREQADYCILCEDAGEGGGLRQYPREERAAIAAEMERLRAAYAAAPRHETTAEELENCAKNQRKAAKESNWTDPQDNHVGWGIGDD